VSGCEEGQGLSSTLKGAYVYHWFGAHKPWVRRDGEAYWAKQRSHNSNRERSTRKSARPSHHFQRRLSQDAVDTLKTNFNPTREEAVAEEEARTVDSEREIQWTWRNRDRCNLFRPHYLAFLDSWEEGLRKGGSAP